MEQFLLYWRWFKGERTAWIAVAVSFFAWGLFGVLISDNEWHLTSASWVVMSVQLACYIYLAIQYSASRNPGEKTGGPTSGQSERWLLSSGVARLTPPMAGLGLLITALGVVGEFAPELLAPLGGGFSHDFTIFALIIGPLLVLACMRLMLTQAAAN